MSTIIWICIGIGSVGFVIFILFLLAAGKKEDHLRQKAFHEYIKNTITSGSAVIKE